jgi:hypothetical protein
MSATRNHARSGARAVLGIAACGLALSLGMRTAFVQADNYALAAKLDGLQREAEWNERRATALRAAALRFEFDAEAIENRSGPEAQVEITQR